MSSLGAASLNQNNAIPTMKSSTMKMPKTILMRSSNHLLKVIK
jgi:hypothetical protein